MWEGGLCKKMVQTVKTSVFQFYFITALNHSLCHWADTQYLLNYSQSQAAGAYPCAWHCRGNERTLRYFLSSLTSDWRGMWVSSWLYCWHLGTDVQPWCDLCDFNPTDCRATPQTLDALASLNCDELIMPGHCSRFRHLLSGGGDYGSNYSYSYIILYRCCHNARNGKLRNYSLFFISVAFLYLLTVFFLLNNVA